MSQLFHGKVQRTAAFKRPSFVMGPFCNFTRDNQCLILSFSFCIKMRLKLVKAAGTLRMGKINGREGGMEG